MRTAITFARKHGSKKLDVLSGPDVAVVKQIESFKEKFCSNPGHETYEYAELWLSDSGRSKKVKLITPQAAKEKAEALEKAKAAAAEAAKKPQQEVKDDEQSLEVKRVVRKQQAETATNAAAGQAETPTKEIK